MRDQGAGHPTYRTKDSFASFSLAHRFLCFAAIEVQVLDKPVPAVSGAVGAVRDRSFGWRADDALSGRPVNRDELPVPAAFLVVPDSPVMAYSLPQVPVGVVGGGRPSRLSVEFRPVSVAPSGHIPAPRWVWLTLAPTREAGGGCCEALSRLRLDGRQGNWSPLVRAFRTDLSQANWSAEQPIALVGENPLHGSLTHDSLGLDGLDNTRRSALNPIVLEEEDGGFEEDRDGLPVSFRWKGFRAPCWTWETIPFTQDWSGTASQTSCLGWWESGARTGKLSLGEGPPWSSAHEIRRQCRPLPSAQHRGVGSSRPVKFRVATA